MKGQKAPSRAGRGRRVKLNCEECWVCARFFARWQALCRLLFLEDLIGPDFEPNLSLAIDRALVEMEITAGRRRGGPVPVGLVVGRIMADLDQRRIDPSYLGNSG